MSWKVSPKMDDILRRGGDFAGIARDEAVELLNLPLESREVCALMETANRTTREQFGLKAENHFHIGVNVAPCPLDCSFCSLTREVGILPRRSTSARNKFWNGPKRRRRRARTRSTS
ncbi:MAG: hypothetical protein ACLFRG_07845 [Desulfococcaceae bacterium]